MDDAFGLPLSTHAREARDAYVEAIDRLLALQGGAGESLERALRADPGFALAHAARGRWLQMCGDAAAARDALARATALAADAGERERAHVAVLALIAAGDATRALAAARAHLDAHPRDALVLSTCSSVFGLIGFSGRVDREAAQLALLERLAPHWDGDGWFLAMHAFAEVETGRVAPGLARAERAFALAPRNANVAHVLAHALYEADDDARTVRELRAWLPGYPRESPLACHLWWHVALCELAAGRLDRVAAILVDEVLPDASRSLPLNTYTDGVSLLWRMSIAGMPTDPAHWRSVREFGERRWPSPGVFVDAHHALALAGDGDADALRAYVAGLEDALARGRLAAGPVVPAIARAAAAWLDGDRARTAALLEPMLDEVVRIGGSRAQRDLVLRTAVVACATAGQTDRADALRARRRAGA
jgi:tetratricopeptide (TPR) repeat protein